MSESYSHWGMFPVAAAADRYADGEIVSLLTGGPEMTVIGGKDGYSLVAWFAGEHLQQALFPVDALYSLEDDGEYDDEDTIGPCAGSC